MRGLSMLIASMMLCFTLASASTAFGQGTDCDAVLKTVYDSYSIDKFEYLDQRSMEYLKKGKLEEDTKSGKVSAGASYAGIGVNGNSENSEFKRFEEALASGTDAAATQLRRTIYLQSVGLKAVADTWLKCKTSTTPVLLAWAIADNNAARVLIHWRPFDTGYDPVTVTSISSSPGVELLPSSTLKVDAKITRTSTLVGQFAINENTANPSVTIAAEGAGPAITVQLPTGTSRAVLERQLSLAEAEAREMKSAFQRTRDSLTALTESNKDLTRRVDELQKWADLDGKVFEGVCGDPHTAYIVWGRTRIPCVGSAQSGLATDGIIHAGDGSETLRNVPNTYNKLRVSGANPFPTPDCIRK